MKHKHYDTIVLGATFLGAGIALCAHGSVLVIERTALIGSEFVDSLNDQPAIGMPIGSEIGRRYEKALVARHLVDARGNLYAAPSMFVLCDMLKHSAVDLLLSSEIVCINQSAGQYEVMIFNCDGWSVFYTDTLIDTTSQGVQHQTAANVGIKKALNVIVHHESAAPPAVNELWTNPITGKSIFSLPVGADDDWLAARQRLYAYFASQDCPLAGWKIAYTATSFAYRFSPTDMSLDDGHRWVPSCSYHDLLHAFDKGGILCESMN